MKHTQVPWLFRRMESAGRVGFALLSVETGAVVHKEEGPNHAWEGENFEGVRYHRSPAEMEADARLFFAAPDLLAACELWDQGFAEGEDFSPEQFLAWVNANRAAARAAIERARGK